MQRDSISSKFSSYIQAIQHVHNINTKYRDIFRFAKEAMGSNAYEIVLFATEIIEYCRIHKIDVQSMNISGISRHRLESLIMKRHHFIRRGKVLQSAGLTRVAVLVLFVIGMWYL